ncbi:MAG: 5-formyltetrahydrofolate cyclo-ligase [Polaribacter sp.]|jgi:5-formyltetrahydrofolate cyclo-ligase
MTIIDEKKKLRKQMLSKRAKFPKPYKRKYDQWICNSLWRTIKEHNFKTVHCFLPMATEINIRPLIENMLNEGIIVITPKTLPKRRLKNLVLNSLDQLEKGVFGTSHPANAKEFLGDYDLIIVPGLAFDEYNNRLGYGGGYYDSFMAKHPDARKIGIFYPFQKAEKIPLEFHDIRLDEVLVSMEF